MNLLIFQCLARDHAQFDVHNLSASKCDEREQDVEPGVSSLEQLNSIVANIPN